MQLLPWQKSVLKDWCANKAQNKPSYTTCGLDVPRQNGKNAVMEIYELYRLVCGWHILHTAHRVKTAKKSFGRLCKYFTNDKYPRLKEMVKQIKRTNGEETILLKNGASVEFISRTNGSARGFDDIQLIVYDEAQDLTSTQFDAITYTLAASSTGERQTIYMGTPPNENSLGDVFASMREAILAGGMHDMCWMSWAAPKLPKEDATFKSLLTEIYKSNPSMGYILDEGYTESEFAGSSGNMLGFAHERLGWWSESAKTAYAISSKLWQGTKLDAIGNAYPKKTAFGLRFSANGERYALVGCKANGHGGWACEVVEIGDTLSGVKPLAEALYKRRTSACAVAIDGIGAADALCEHLRELKAPRGFALRVKTSDVILAAAAFLDALTTNSVKHTPNAALDTAAAHCVRRVIGKRGGWGFGAADGVDATPIEAAALALWACKSARRNPKRRQRLQ